jgi:hypothetical protein
MILSAFRFFSLNSSTVPRFFPEAVSNGLFSLPAVAGERFRSLDTTRFVVDNQLCPFPFGRFLNFHSW